MSYGSFAYGGIPLGGFFPFAPELFFSRKIKLYFINLLESGTVAVTSENAAFPKYRLYDRSMGLLFKGASAPSIFGVTLDQGVLPSYPIIDTIILGANHNLNGLTVRLYYSDDGTNYEQVTAWTASSGINKRHFTLQGHRYWLFRIENPSTAPELSELFLTRAYAFERNPNWGYDYGDLDNIHRLESRSGQIQKTRWGPPRKLRDYELTGMSEAQRIDIETFKAETGNTKSFFIEDLEGNLFFAELPEPLPPFKAEPLNRWGLRMRILEVLP